MVSDLLRVPFAEHMLVPVPNGVPPARAAAASDNLADAWRAVVGPLRERPGGRVLVLGGGAKNIGLYAAGLGRHARRVGRRLPRR
jgi:NADPH:quinone reductase-like Zn-dependent oxidoreductase